MRGNKQYKVKNASDFKTYSTNIIFLQLYNNIKPHSFINVFILNYNNKF